MKPANDLILKLIETYGIVDEGNIVDEEDLEMTEEISLKELLMDK